MSNYRYSWFQSKKLCPFFLHSLSLCVFLQKYHAEQVCMCHELFYNYNKWLINMSLQVKVNIRRKLSTFNFSFPLGKLSSFLIVVACCCYFFSAVVPSSINRKWGIHHNRVHYWFFKRIMASWKINATTMVLYTVTLTYNFTLTLSLSLTLSHPCSISLTYSFSIARHILRILYALNGWKWHRWNEQVKRNKNGRPESFFSLLLCDIFSVCLFVMGCFNSALL